MNELFLRPLPRRYAIALACVSYLILVLVFVMQPLLVAEVLASVINLKFGVLLLLSAFALRFINSVVIAISLALTFKVYVFITMQDFWEVIGYEPDFILSWLKTSFGSLLILSPIEAWFAHRANKGNASP